MKSRSVDIFINGNLFRTWDIPDNIGLVNIRVYGSGPADTSRHISNEIINPRAKTFTARITRGNTAHVNSNEIEWIDGSPYLRKVKMKNKKQKKGGRTIQYPANFKPDCNITFDGKAGMAKLTLPALGEIMRQLAAQQGPPPRVFTMPIELKKIDAPLTNVIWISPDIAAAIEEHMIARKKKKEIKLAADVADVAE